jgi:AbrB family looped-hinge helix DNA binding protein
MTATTVKLSSKGQVVIPKTVREQLHWEAGAELTLVTTSDGVLLKGKPKKGKRNLADLRGLLKYDGPPIPIEELCKPVELTEEELKEYKR